MVGFTPQRILVPVGGVPTDVEAVRLACRLARRGKAKVMVVTVLEIKRSLALGTVQDVEMDTAETLLDAAEKIARELETEIETELLQARDAGPAIVEEIAHWKADLVVVGMPFRLRFGEFHMGRTAPYILRHAPCRALLFREPPT
ncbi:MAG: universal stress protein [Candidatus Dormibacteraeota bacterium]|uniref:Universal stress protein n=1 Tax=Candidatus Aeolococcus gillhamiae TaxID=3127015 RepID=A0A2W5Z4B0_9BACT|nr:universal stress protein [Candidatus Dormibacteraeota bacterium]PZR80159.1 MAG: universal stress protein [Candidatus Dormibacter sp. RRmetagenome_bin12]